MLAMTLTWPRQCSQLDAVQKAVNAWVKAFNSGDAVSAANDYESDAVMTALPFGTFAVESISKFF